jgi:hypothetical protein
MPLKVLLEFEFISTEANLPVFKNANSAAGLFCFSFWLLAGRS